MRLHLGGRGFCGGGVHSPHQPLLSLLPSPKPLLYSKSIHVCVCKMKSIICGRSVNRGALGQHFSQRIMGQSTYGLNSANISVPFSQTCPARLLWMTKVRTFYKNPEPTDKYCITWKWDNCTAEWRQELGVQGMRGGQKGPMKQSRVCCGGLRRRKIWLMGCTQASHKLSRLDRSGCG